MRHAAEMPIKHEAKPSALLVLKQFAKCYILCIGRARPCFNYFKELTHECLVKAYPFQSIKTILDDILGKGFSE